MRKPIFLLLLMLFGCSETPERVEPAARAIAENIPLILPSAVLQQYDRVVDLYLDLKDALIAGDSEMATQKAGRLQEVLQEAAPALAAAKVPDVDKLRQYVQEMIAAENLTKQRERFSPLSDMMIEQYKKAPGSRAMYVQNCPMALENTGANWLSKSSEVVNPYFGDVMLHCGSLTESLAAAPQGTK